MESLEPLSDPTDVTVSWICVDSWFGPRLPPDASCEYYPIPRVERTEPEILDIAAR